MSKAKLETAKDLYDAQLARAVLAEREGDYRRVVREAKACWEYVYDAMKHVQKSEGSIVASMPCIDLVLGWAPALMDAGSLVELGVLLKSTRGIDRMATDDLADRLARAEARLAVAHRIWNVLMSDGPASVESLVRRLGHPSEVREIMRHWQAMGVVTPEGDREGALRLTTDLGEVGVGRCYACGAMLKAKRRAFLATAPCPACGATTEFVMVGGQPAVAGGG